MDGPYVNHKFYQEMVKRREELEISNKMIDIGSSGLHIIHAAFKTGIKSTNWAAEKTYEGAVSFFMTHLHGVQITYQSQ